MIRALWVNDVLVTMGTLEWATFPPERMDVDDASIGAVEAGAQVDTTQPPATQQS